MSAVLQIKSVYYPESDGKPMGETDEHRDVNVDQIEVLRNFFKGQEVYVSGNILVYYEQGNPKKFVVPDTLVAKGLEQRRRRIYKTWVEGKAPDVVIETTSRKTKTQDTKTKSALYAKLGVKEYFLFDPTDEYLEPSLRGYRLIGGEYTEMKAESDGSLVSRELGLRLRKEDGRLIFYRLSNGRRLLNNVEMRDADARRHKAELAAVEEKLALERSARLTEAKAREEAEAELARVREELLRLRK